MKRGRYLVTEVIWLDSVQLENGDWMTLDDVRAQADDLRCRSVGYLVHESETTLVLARSISEWSEDSVEKVEGVLCVPKVAVVDQ